MSWPRFPIWETGASFFAQREHLMIRILCAT